MQINFDKAMALHQADVLDIGVKEVAYHLNKGVSTLYGEIRQENGYKQGLIDFFRTVERHGCMNALKSLVADLGYCLYKLPSSKIDKKAAIALVHRILARASKEFGDSSVSTLEALADGTITRQEAAATSRECQEAIEELAQLKAVMDAIKNGTLDL